MSNGTAIQLYKGLVSLMSTEDVRTRFERVLGERSPQFIASVLNTVAQNDALMECDHGSIIRAALTAAALDLPVDPNLGFAWIIPYRDGKQGGKRVARFQMGYKGYIQLAQRSREYEKINVIPVYEGESVVEDRLTGDIKLNGRRSGDAVIGYVAFFRLLSGFEKCEYWTVEEVTDHARNYSQSYGNTSSPWSKSFDAMAKKSVLKSLLSTYGPLSITPQLAKAVAEDAGDERTLEDAIAEDQEREEQREEPVEDAEYRETDEAPTADPPPDYRDGPMI